MSMDQVDEPEKITRIEVIGDGGRLLVKWGIRLEDIQIQDYGRTLKIFIRDRDDRNRN